MNDPNAKSADLNNRRSPAHSPELPEQERAYLIAAVAATHDLLIMNNRPDLAPESFFARVAVRSGPWRRSSP